MDTPTLLIPAGVLSGWLVVWLLVGYVFFSLISATLGSLISRPEDAPQVTTPLTVLVAGIFGLGLPVSVYPNGLYSRLLSFFPPTAAPTLMLRLPTGQVGTFEQLAALGVTLAAIWGLTHWASGVYGRTALAFGERVRFSVLFGRQR